MKFAAFVLISILFVGCSQKQQKKISVIDSFPNTLTIDTGEIIDSKFLNNYLVVSDTAYFYARADSNTKIESYLTKSSSTVICKKNGAFGYAVMLTDSSLQSLGWVKLGDLSQIFFTPPKVVQE